MTIKKLFSDYKNRVIIYLTFGFIIISIFYVIIFFDNRELIEEKEAKCTLGVMGSNGIGFETYALLSCENLKKNCESNQHDIPCIWEEFENEKGCKCTFWE